MASDFRDIYIERSELGRGIIAFYYKHSLTPLRVLGCALLILIGGIGVSLWVVLYLFVAKHRSAPLSTQSA